MGRGGFSPGARGNSVDLKRIGVPLSPRDSLRHLNFPFPGVLARKWLVSCIDIRTSSSPMRNGAHFTRCRTRRDGRSARQADEWWEPRIAPAWRKHTPGQTAFDRCGPAKYGGVSDLSPSETARAAPSPHFARSGRRGHEVPVGRAASTWGETPREQQRVCHAQRPGAGYADDVCHRSGPEPGSPASHTGTSCPSPVIAASMPAPAIGCPKAGCSGRRGPRGAMQKPLRLLFEDSTPGASVITGSARPDDAG